VREWTIRHHVAGMEFVGVDKSARCGKGGHCRSGKCRSGQLPVKNVLKTSWKSHCMWDQLTCDNINSQLSVSYLDSMVCAHLQTACILSNSPFSTRQTRWRQVRETTLLRSGPVSASRVRRRWSAWGQMSTLQGWHYYDPSSVLKLWPNKVTTIDWIFGMNYNNLVRLYS